MSIAEYYNELADSRIISNEATITDYSTYRDLVKSVDIKTWTWNISNVRGQTGEGLTSNDVETLSPGCVNTTLSILGYPNFKYVEQPQNLVTALFGAIRDLQNRVTQLEQPAP